MNPLTRPAPADENAGCGPPSPPRGRGREIQSPQTNSPLVRRLTEEGSGGEGVDSQKRHLSERYWG
jgi:hypothetical protein